MRQVLTILFVIPFTAAIVFAGFLILESPHVIEEPVWAEEASLFDLVLPLTLPRLPLYEGMRDELVSSGTAFIEANLDDMAIRMYRDGTVAEEVGILAKGDPQGWGGSPAGLYDIMSGNPVSYSVASEVYMPHAMRYYGKYYLHGEPYYPGGEKLLSTVSGGCLRQIDADAQTTYELAEIGMPVLVVDKLRDDFTYPSIDRSQPNNVTAKAFLVADLDSGHILAQHNSTEALPMASITKLMTAIVIAENVDLRRHIQIQDYMLEPYGDTEGIVAGVSYRIVELLYPLLIESSNDAAETLSYFLGKERTLQLMNEKADAIMMTSATFTDPSGFDPGNVASARDLFYLARYVFNNRFPLLEITKGKHVLSFGDVRFDVPNLWNKNIFITDDTFIGGKTGFITQSKETALFIFRLQMPEGEKRNIAITLLGSADEETDTQRIYRWLLDTYFSENLTLDLAVRYKRRGLARGQSLFSGLIRCSENPVR